jgi:hypothetical protein
MIAARSRTVVMHDPDTGLTVSSESVRNPAGGTDFRFVFSDEARHFAHLLPFDQFDPRAASRAFDEILHRLQAGR